MCELPQDSPQLEPVSQLPRSEPQEGRNENSAPEGQPPSELIDRRQARVFRSLQRLLQHPAVNAPEFYNLNAAALGELMSPKDVKPLTVSTRSIGRSTFRELAQQELGASFARQPDSEKNAIVESYIQRNRAVASKPSLSDRHFIYSVSKGYSPSSLIVNEKIISQVVTKKSTASNTSSAHAIHKLLTETQKKREQVARLEAQSKRAAEKKLKQATKKRGRPDATSPENPSNTNETAFQNNGTDNTKVAATEDAAHGNVRVTRSSAQKPSKSTGVMPASKCCFCPDPSLFGGEELNGELLGPFVDRKGRAKLFVHFNCANWAPQVFTDSKSGQLRGVYDEYCRARQLKCSDCGGRGATIGCYVKRCKRVFHFRCISSSNAKTVERHFAAYCEKHAHLVETSLYQTLMEAATIADVAAAHRREDSTFGLDAPHSRYTQLRRRETEIIFSKKLGVCSHSGAYETNRVIFSHKRRRIIKKTDRLSLADRARCLLATAFDIASGRLAYMTVAGTDKDPDAMTPVEARAALASREHTSVLLLRNLRKAPKWTKSQIQLVKKLSGSTSEKLPSQKDKDRSNKSGQVELNQIAETHGVAVEGNESTSNIEISAQKLGQLDEENGRGTKRRRISIQSGSSNKASEPQDGLPDTSQNLINTEQPSGCSNATEVEELGTKSDPATALNQSSMVKRRADPKKQQDRGSGKPDRPAEGAAQSGRQGLAGKVKSAWEIFLEEQLPKERLLRPDDPEADAMRNMARLWSLLSNEEREAYQEKARQSGLAAYGMDLEHTATAGSTAAGGLVNRTGINVDRNADNVQARSRGQAPQRTNQQRRSAGLFARSNRSEEARDASTSKPHGSRKEAKSQPSVSLPSRIRIEHRSGNITHYDELVAVDWDDLLPSTLEDEGESASAPVHVRPLPSRDRRKSR